jgi:hypothetical protein
VGTAAASAVSSAAAAAAAAAVPAVLSAFLLWSSFVLMKYVQILFFVPSYRAVPAVLLALSALQSFRLREMLQGNHSLLDPRNPGDDLGRLECDVL